MFGYSKLKWMDEKAAQIIVKEFAQINQKIDSFKDDLTDLKNDVMQKMDDVCTEVIAIRQEQAGHSQQHEDIQLDIESIRSIPSIAHQLKK